HSVPTHHHRSATCGFFLRLGLLSLAATAPASAQVQPQGDPQAILREADRLVWMKAWSKAGPLFEQARAEFAGRGDRRNELYAEINLVRVNLPRTAVPEASRLLDDYLDDPLVRSDDAMRLRCLVIKGETDEDLDPTLANAAWREALVIAER